MFLPIEKEYEHTPINSVDKIWWGKNIVQFFSTYGAPTILAAYDAARQARFEFGKRGNA